MLVLNASYEPLNVCTVRRALVLILKEKAEVLEHGDGVLRSETMRLDRPEVIRLVSFVRVPRDIHRRRITRKAVLARDGWTCQYCGTEKPGLTVDHVIPRSRGGESVWENIVASCAACNRRKGNRMPHEIRMHPRDPPAPARPDGLHPHRRPADPGGLGALLTHRVAERLALLLRGLAPAALPAAARTVPLGLRLALGLRLGGRLAASASGFGLGFGRGFAFGFGAAGLGLRSALASPRPWASRSASPWLRLRLGLRRRGSVVGRPRPRP